jgi:hypothetical protein
MQVPCPSGHRVRAPALSITPRPSCATRRGFAAIGRARPRRDGLSGEFMLISIAIGLSVSTLCATGLLFVVQMVDDFREG